MLTADGGRLFRNVNRFRGGLVFKAHRLCVSLNSRIESNKEEKKAVLTLTVCAGVSECCRCLHARVGPSKGNGTKCQL